MVPELLELGRLGLELGVAALGGPPDPLQPPLDGREVGEQQLGVDGLDVALGVDVAVDVHHVLVLEAAHDVGYRVALPYVTQKLVAEPLTGARTAHQPGDVHEVDRRGDDALAPHHPGQRVQAPVRDRGDAQVRVDGGERIILCLGPGPREAVEYR